MTRVLLAGEDNPYGSDPRFALYHLPEGASGDRLRRILGLRVCTYEALDKVNLCDGSWYLPHARDRVDKIVQEFKPEVVVMCGRKVATAFRYDGEFFTARAAPWGWDGAPPTLVSIPHPSGRCTLWNSRGNVDTARSLLARVAPDVPWGEIDRREIAVETGQ